MKKIFSMSFRIKQKEMISILDMTLAGMAIAFLTISKYLDHIIPKAPVGASWIELYTIIGIICVFVMPVISTTIAFLVTPLIWLALGETWQSGPGSFILDYSVPMLALLVVHLSELKVFNKNTYVKLVSSVSLIIIAFIIKWQSHAISGTIFWDVKYIPSMGLNATFTVVDCAASIIIFASMFKYIPHLKKSISTRTESKW